MNFFVVDAIADQITNRERRGFEGDLAMNRGRGRRNDLGQEIPRMRRREEEEQERARVREHVHEWAARANLNGRLIAFVRQVQDIHEGPFMDARAGRDALLYRIQVFMGRFEARRGIADEPIACEEVEVD